MTKRQKHSKYINKINENDLKQRKYENRTKKLIVFTEYG